MKARFVVSLAAALALMIFIPGGTGAVGVGVGKTCGGFIGIQCDAGLFCQQEAGTCGMFDRTGKCARAPHFCPRVTGPTIQVCGCNGETYINDCERQKAMVSLRHRRKCE